MEGKGKMIVDFENHYIPEGVSYPKNLEAIWDIDKRIKFMDESGVDMAVLTSEAGWNAPLDLCKLITDKMVEIVHKHPGRFTTLAHVNPMAGPAAIQEIRRAVEELKLPGVCLPIVIDNEVMVDDKRLWGYYEAVSDLGAVIHFHPALGSSSYNLAPERGYHVSMVREFDMAISVARLIFGGVVKNFPGMKIVISHTGGVIGAARDRLIHSGPHYGLDGFEEGFAQLNFNLAGHHGGEITLKLAASTIDASKLLYASDYPYGFERPELERKYIDLIRSLDMSEQAINGMLGQNAVSLLGLGL